LLFSGKVHIFKVKHNSKLAKGAFAMLKNIKNRDTNQKGFTIIEVLIVLAIAGLILLIVFLAVPALQRNSRNTSIKNDVQNVIGGISEFQNANNGVLPSAATTNATTPGEVDYTRNGGNATSIKTQGSTTVSSNTAAPAQTAPAQSVIVISLGYRCDGTASPRAISAVYSIEASSGAVRQCQDS
jgi:prepilin-type N-terminal cleavage/methylation domain-containing protein